MKIKDRPCKTGEKRTASCAQMTPNFAKRSGFFVLFEGSLPLASSGGSVDQPVASGLWRLGEKGLFFPRKASRGDAARRPYVFRDAPRSPYMLRGAEKWSENAKNVKKNGTNSISHLESIKVSTNDLKMNWKKHAENTQKSQNEARK
jgi:hypothetical protein